MNEAALFGTVVQSAAALLFIAEMAIRLFRKPPSGPSGAPAGYRITRHPRRSAH